jgi:hypothetical protein
MSSEASSVNAVDLKRLGWVQVYCQSGLSKGYGLATSVYSTAKTYAPASLNPVLAAVEDKVSEYGTPLAHQGADFSERILELADKKVGPGLRGRRLSQAGVAFKPSFERARVSSFPARRSMELSSPPTSFMR